MEFTGGVNDKCGRCFFSKQKTNIIIIVEWRELLERNVVFLPALGGGHDHLSFQRFLSVSVRVSCLLHQSRVLSGRVTWLCLCVCVIPVSANCLRSSLFATAGRFH